MLSFALVPTVSRALALGVADSAWAEVCTPNGVEWVSTSHGDGVPTQMVSHLDHCAFCSLAGHAAAPPPATRAAVQLPAGSTLLPQLFLQAPHTLAAWRSAQPRGPPRSA